MREAEPLPTQKPDYDTQDALLADLREKHTTYLQRAGIVDSLLDIIFTEYNRRQLQLSIGASSPRILYPPCLEDADNTQVVIRRNQMELGGIEANKWAAQRYSVLLVTPYRDEFDQLRQDTHTTIVAEAYNDWAVPHDHRVFTPMEAQLVVDLGEELVTLRESRAPDLVYDLTHIARQGEERPWNANL